MPEERERGELQIDAVITGINLDANGKPWVNVALPPKADPQVAASSSYIGDHRELSVFAQFPNSDIPLNLNVGEKVIVKLSFRG